ncbi:MAG: hypothetical protein M2R45_04139 [Verrucomicrobia subdivision 3 bacterium]|nr:hypothetical protein [Limisphaerales bacterium]MCS1417681.1 hypothetical protein [Limisphaerales bacterium]
MNLELSQDFTASRRLEVKDMTSHVMQSPDCSLAAGPSKSLLDTIDLSRMLARTQTTEPHEIKIPNVLKKWTPGLERRFCVLVEKKADGKATPQEREELEHLKQDRRRLKYPLPTAHLIRDYQRRKALLKILSQINEQVERIRP